MKYLLLTLKHKWFVLLAGFKIKAPLWRLLIHDWTKLLPVELPHYQKQFFGKKDDPVGFVKCWLHHQNSNPHHWEYWVPRTGHDRCDPPIPDNEPLPMPLWAVKEMIADWMGAGRAYEGKYPQRLNWGWLENNLKDMRLHCLTKRRIFKVIARMWNIHNEPTLVIPWYRWCEDNFGERYEYDSKIN